MKKLTKWVIFYKLFVQEVTYKKSAVIEASTINVALKNANTHLNLIHFGKQTEIIAIQQA